VVIGNDFQMDPVFDGGYAPQVLLGPATNRTVVQGNIMRGPLLVCNARFPDETEPMGVGGNVADWVLQAPGYPNPGCEAVLANV
jgi:hypothetical protein